MMKRREFFKTAGSAAVVLSAGSMLAFDLPPSQKERFSTEELKTALDTYFAEMMAGKYFSPDRTLPGTAGRLMIVKSYSIEVIKEKNCIFDISDLIIKKLKASGFDAGSLKEGKIPEGLVVSPGLLSIPGALFPIRIDELKNYDAVLSVSDYSSITTKELPSNWKDISSFKKEEFSNGAFRYRGSPYFVLAGKKGSQKDLEFRFNVDLGMTPLKIIEHLPEMISMDFIAAFFTNEQLETIKI